MYGALEMLLGSVKFNKMKDSNWSDWNGVGFLFCFTCLAVVGTAVLGHSTLSVNKEAVSATLLWQGCLVALGDEGVQLRLLTADGLHKLREHTDTQTGMSNQITSLKSSIFLKTCIF